MKNLEIKLEGIILSNEGLDNDNFIDIKITEEDESFSIDELYSALSVFIELRETSAKRDKLLTLNNQ